MDWDRVEDARNLGRVMLTIPILLIGLLALGWTAAPQVTGGGMGPRPVILEILPVIGVVGFVVGWVWMWRIHEAPTRFEEPLWRYRDR